MFHNFYQCFYYISVLTVVYLKNTCPLRQPIIMLGIFVCDLTECDMYSFSICLSVCLFCCCCCCCPLVFECLGVVCIHSTSSLQFLIVVDFLKFVVVDF